MKRKLELKAAPPTSTPAFDTRPSAVRRWVRELPSGNIAETGRRVLEAMRQVNGHETPARRRLHFLEATAPACRLALSDLQRHYAHQPLPLGEAGARAVHLAVELLTELLRGYYATLRALLPEKEETSRWRVLWYRRELTATLHRFIHYGDRLLEVYRVLHMDPPEGAWKRINRCYRIAEAHGLLRRRASRAGEKGRRTTIAQEYKRLLLSALLPAGALSRTQQEAIGATLDGWARLLRLVPPGPRIEAAHLVRLARDDGPLAVAYAPADALASPNTRLLDTTALGQALARHRARDGKGRRWLREVDMDPATLALAHQYWCSPPRRAEEREEVDLPAQVAIGLGALFHLAGGASRPAAAKIAVPPPRERGNWLGRQPGDVWGAIYPEGRQPPRVETPPRTPAANPDYRALPGRVMNRSVHGIALVVPRSELQQAAIGMLVAVRTAGEEWIVASVVRLRDKGDEVELGMKIVMRGAVPVHVHTREGPRTSPRVDGVVGHPHDGGMAIAVPAIEALGRGEFLLEWDGKEFPLRRGATLTHSRFFDVFIIDRPDREAQEAIAAAARAAATRAPSAGAASPPRANPPAPREHRVEEVMRRTGLGRADAEFIIEAERQTQPPP